MGVLFRHLLCLVLLSIALHVEAQTEYTLTFLSPPPDGYVLLEDMNSRGDAVGRWVAPDGSGRPVLYSDGSFTVLSDHLGLALAINERGDVTGYLNTGIDTQPFLWSNGEMSTLGNPFGSARAYGMGINNSGAITGVLGGHPTVHPDVAFVYSHGVMTPIGTLEGESVPFGARSAGADINDRGQITGNSTVSGGREAFLFSDGTMTSLGTLGGASSWGFAINNRGEVVGQSLTDAAGSFYLGFIYSGGAMTPISVVDGYRSIAVDINDRGQVIGTYGSPEGGLDAGSFLYRDGVVQDIGDMLDPATDAAWLIAGVTAITNNGQILGYAFDRTNPTDFRPVVLTPVPEPSTYLLMLVGLGVLGLVARRIKVTHGLVPAFPDTAGSRLR